MDATQPETDPPDAAIIRRVLDGDRAAYAAIIRRYERPLRAALAPYFISNEEIEEQLQEAFVQAFLALNTFDASAPLYPWLKGITSNLLKMEFRRLQTSRRRNADYLRHLQLSRLDQEPQPSDGEARAEALRHCLAKLPEADAALLSEKYGENRPLAELAARLACTVGALKVRLLRLRHALRACIHRTLAAERTEHGTV